MIKKIKIEIFNFFVNSPLGYRLAKGAFWSLLGSVIFRGSQLLASILIARMLGKVKFGELATIQNTTGMFGTLAGFGLGLTATKFIAEFRKSNPERAGRIRGLSSIIAWVTSTVTAIILFVIAPWLAKHTLAAPHLGIFLQISTIYLLFNAVNGAQTGALAGFEAFKTIAKVNLWAGLSTFPLMITGVYFFDLYGAIIALIFSSLFNWGLNHIAIKRECIRNNITYDYKESWKERSILWKFTLPTVLAGLMTGPITWATNALLVNQADGYASMGIYNAVLRIKQVPEMILAMLMAPLLPILSEQYGKKINNDYSKTLNYAFSISFLIIIPISLVQIAFPHLSLLPYGKVFQGNNTVVQWLMFHAVILGLFYPFTSIIASMNRMWFGWGFNLFHGIILISLAYFLIPKYGATGLASATAITYGFASLIVFGYIYRKEKQFIEGIKLSQNIILVLFVALLSTLFSFNIMPIFTGTLAVLITLFLLFKIYFNYKLIAKNL